MGDRRGQRHDGGDEQFRKIFVGGLSYETTDESLRRYFETFGEITDCIVMKDSVTKRSRGFGFVAFKEKEMVDATQAKRPHVIDGKEVDTKRAMPRADSNRPEAHASVKRIFLGGVKAGVQEKDIQEHFTQYGQVAQVEIMLDKTTGEPRGFGFLTFEDPDSVDQAVLTQYHTIAGMKIEARKALSKNEMNQAQERLQTRQSRRGGGDGGRGRDFGDRSGGFNRGGGGGGGFGNYNSGGGGSWGGNGGNYNQSYSQSYNQGGGNFGNQGGYNQGSYGGGGGGSNWAGNQGGGGGNWQGNQQQYGQQSWSGNQQSGYSQGSYNQGGSGSYGGGGPMGQDRSYSQRSSGPYGGGYGNQGGGGGGYRR